MNLLVVRHAIAEDRAEVGPGQPDDFARPLTPEGRAKMTQGARGLRTVVPELQVLASSPLVRARETADIIAAAYRPIVPIVVPELAPGHTSKEVARWLERQDERGVVAIVGHEPGLSRTVSWLLAGGDRSVLELKKGAACLLALGDAVGPGCAALLWALAPTQLRALGAAAT
jgi:phosphohistidine phosphatase